MSCIVFFKLKCLELVYAPIDICFYVVDVVFGNSMGTDEVFDAFDEGVLMNMVAY